MEDFLKDDGFWILPTGVFVARRRFGIGCGGGHRHGWGRDDERVGSSGEKSRAASLRHARGCH